MSYILMILHTFIMLLAAALNDKCIWDGIWSSLHQRDGKTCSDINECLLSPEICEGGGVCVNTQGSFTCDCPPGLTLDSSRTKCVDLREETCHLHYRNGQCSQPLDGTYKKAMCCCTVGAAWGSDRSVLRVFTQLTRRRICLRLA